MSQNSLFLDYKYVSEDQIVDLEKTFSPEEIKRQLSTIFKVEFSDRRKASILSDFHFYNYGFCKTAAFDNRKTGTFLSIMNEIFKRDSTQNVVKNITESFAYLQMLLLNHSIENPPKSILVFQTDDVGHILDFVATSYYQHFKLYRYIFAPKTRIMLSQGTPNDIQLPCTCFGGLPFIAEGLKTDQTSSYIDNHSNVQPMSPQGSTLL